MNRPTLVLADEPTGNLDSRTGDEIVEILVGLRAGESVTVLIATHDAQVAARCDRVVRLLDGHVSDDVDVRAVSDTAATMARLSRPAPR